MKWGHSICHQGCHENLKTPSLAPVTGPRGAKLHGTRSIHFVCPELAHPAAASTRAKLSFSLHAAPGTSQTCTRPPAQCMDSVPMGTHTYLEEALPPQFEGHTPRRPAGHLRSVGLAVPGAPGRRSRGAGGVPPPAPPSRALPPPWVRQLSDDRASCHPQLPLCQPPKPLPAPPQAPG